MEYPFSKNDCFDDALEKLPCLRPAIKKDITASTAVVCLSMQFEETLSKIVNEHKELPTFYVLGKIHNIPEHILAKVTVKPLSEISPSMDIHVYPLNKKLPGSSGFNKLVLALTKLNIHSYSIESSVVSKFYRYGEKRIFSKDELEDIKIFYNSLEDMESRYAYLGACKARMEGDPGLIPIAAYPQYYHPEVGIKSGEILVEGGPCNGVTTVNFLKAVGESGKIYAFEPVPQCYNDTLEKVNGYANVRVIDKALWKENCTLNLKLGPEHLGSSSVDFFNSTGQLCEGVSLDTFFTHQKKPNVIKLDVEGAELPVLQGAINTIKECQPKLLISIYHVGGGNDLVNIPAFFNSLGIKYKFYVGHHMAWFAETMLYATVEG